MEEIIFWVEDAADSGVKKIADKVAGDVELVTDRRPRVLYGTSQEELADVAERAETVIVPATVGKSRLLEQMEEEKRIGLEQIRGKRECYGWFFLNDPEWHGTQILLIAGSDKRGTIYGLFHLSELLGVSPFVDWCGIRPPHREHVGLRASMACVAGEPSVRYRGFFINDEWPAFGTWCNRRFGGFGTSVYEHVFELLLRLKGNYLWPAMWSARFGDDGPGLANAKLADEYGIIMGMSHHEPCLRQGEEYKYLRGKDSVYGDAWNFRTNREGIIRFWKDGLLRRGKFENVITLGMRGEADTAILGEKATLEDNIELLRDVLKTQNELIRECVDEDVKRVPRMLALYKEVEAFFYGNDQTAGLMGLNVNMISLLVFAISGITAGLAGVFYGMKYTVYPAMGSVSNKAFIAAVIGGLGSLPGAVIGGVLLGLLETLVSSYVSTTFRDLFSYSALIVVLLFMPNGLLGKNAQDKL